MQQITDSEVGPITIKRYRNSTSIKLRIKPDGSVHVSAPTYAPQFVIKRFLTKSKPEILRVKQQLEATQVRRYNDQDIIGKHHKVVLVREGNEASARIVGRMIRWVVPARMAPESSQAQEALRGVIDKALRKQAKQYLPSQLAHLASRYKFHYETVRFGNAKGRWGSCSSTGTISLNIALMNLPNELIDYVLLHELCHTKQLNHSQAFWKLLEDCSPDYKKHKKELKNYSPYI